MSKIAPFVSRRLANCTCSHHCAYAKSFTVGNAHIDKGVSTIEATEAAASVIFANYEKLANLRISLVTVRR